jgi:hypothetical protein
MPSSSLLATVLLVGALSPLAVADTLINTLGPYNWTDSCGDQMQITVTVYSNVTGYPDLYRWDYQISDVTASNPVELLLIQPSPLPDIANTYSSTPNWYFFDLGLTVNGTTELVAEAASGSYYLGTGQTIHIGFTTLPRGVTILPACSSGTPCSTFALESWYGLANFNLCSFGDLVGDIAVPGSLTSSGLQITQIATPDAVTGISPSTTPQTTSNTTSAFATTDSSLDVVVLKGSGTVTVVGTDFASGDGVLWKIDRDPSDTVDAATLSTASTSDTQATFSPTTAGNFRLIAYIDTNANGSFDEGEQLAVLRFAIVQATLQTSASSFTLNQSGIVGVIGPSPSFQPGVTSKGAFPGSVRAMSLQAVYLLEGGGSVRTIGTSAISIGDVGNLTGDSFAIDYPVPTPTPAAPGNVDGTGTEVPGCATGPCGSPAYPMVDAGTPPFRTNSQPLSSGLPAAPGTGGLIIGITSFDTPGWGPWAINHPTTMNLWDSTSGSNSFCEFIVAATTSFPLTYTVQNSATWTATIIGTNDSNLWDDGNAAATVLSTIAGDSALASSCGTAVQLYSPSFTTHTITYQP